MPKRTSTHHHGWPLAELWLETQPGHIGSRETTAMLGGEGLDTLERAGRNACHHGHAISYSVRGYDPDTETRSQPLRIGDERQHPQNTLYGE